MKYTLHYEFDSLEELQAHIAGSATPKKAAKKEKPAPAPTPEPVAETPVEVVAPPTAKKIEYKDVKELVGKLMTTKGAETVRQLLKSFGANKVGEVKESDFQAVADKCNEILSE